VAHAGQPTPGEVRQKARLAGEPHRLAVWFESNDWVGANDGGT